MTKVRYILSFVFILATALLFADTVHSNIPPELQSKLDYVKDNPDCTMEYVEELEAELLKQYPADGYVFFRINSKKSALYFWNGDYEKASKYLDTARDILKKHTSYDDADAIETEEEALHQQMWSDEESQIFIN